MRSTEKIIGGLFLLAFPFYGIGFGLLSEQILQMKTTNPVNIHLSATGFILMILNSVCVIGIGLLLYTMLSNFNKLIAKTYLILRILEALFLGFGSIYLYTTISSFDKLNIREGNLLAVAANFAEQYNHTSYQIAMLILGIGSALLCFVLLKFKLVPKFISLLGLLGYSILFMGSIAELYKIEIGIFSSILGGFFEIIFSYFLIFKGIKYNKS
ncbi:MAG: DUF4386 domain-containing protein [Sphingobacteriia bacterium]|nr:MAG: DUF4386 domain-containing protein [Sphingobacteriia bacterium]